MNRRKFCKLAVITTTATACLAETPQPSKPENRFMLDMVHISPGESAPKTAFLDPSTLARLGYNGQVVLSLIEGVANFGALSPSLIPAGSVEHIWSAGIAHHIDSQIIAAHAAGLRCFAWMQLVVFPIAVVRAYKAEICDEQGRIDIALPTTKKLLRIQIEEIFQRFPRLDGLLIRTGEVYLHDLPYHASTSEVQQAKTQGSSAILHGEKSHYDLLTLLRQQVCVEHNRHVFYRTWDFGEHFHENPAYYLRVTDAIEPHSKLLFSIKHQKGDFHQLTPFNPTLMIGKHRQIVEVQCQREAYGKGAHPYYVGDGVINGWEEMSRLVKPSSPRGLRDIIHHPLYAGTWTWSRGGGWEGPYISNEMWCTLNVYVISKFSLNPHLTEPQILRSYARSIGLRGKDIDSFRDLQLLSAKGVLRGQLTNLPAIIDVWWTRDDKFGNPDLSDFIAMGLTQAAIAEKAEASRIWTQMIEIASQISWPDAPTKDFVMTSMAYGTCKYAIIESAWTALLLGREGDSLKRHNVSAIQKAIGDYDSAWLSWRRLYETHASCATLYKDVAFADKPGLGAAVDHYRNTTE